MLILLFFMRLFVPPTVTYLKDGIYMLITTYTICITLKDVNGFLSAILSLTTIFGIILGVGKLKEMIQLYRTRYVDAVFGFYSKLEAHCAMLESALSKLKLTPYYTDNEQPTDDVMKADCKRVKCVAEDFLKFFSTENNQLPQKDVKSGDRNKLWSEQMKALRTYLGECTLMGVIEPVGKQVNTQQGFIDEFEMVLKYFKEKIPEIRNELLKKMPDIKDL